MSPYVGRIVTALCGHDKDRLYLVVGEENGYLFLADGKLVVMAAPVDGYGNAYYLDGECTTDVEIYDVSNASSPVLLRSFSQEGTYQEARIIDGSLLLVSRKYTSIRTDGDFSFDPQEVIPKICDDVLTEEPAILPADSVYCMPNVNSTVFTVISMVELDSQQPAKSMTVLGEGILYANYENI